jgi:hypothetical protein
MKDWPRSWSGLYSRRALLQGAARAAAGAMALAANPKSAASAPKMSQKVAAYQDHPNGDKRCDKCVQFQPPDACKVVEGVISPQGSCRIFMPGRTPT